MNFNDKVNYSSGRTRRYISIVITLLVLVLIGLGVWFFLLGGNTSKNKGISDNSIVSSEPILTTYPEGWEELEINASFAQADVILNARKKMPQVKLIATAPKSVQGKLDPSFDIESLPKKLATSYEKKYDNFQLVKNEIVNVDKYKSVKMHSQYSVKDNSEVMGYINMVIPTPKATYYLNYQAKVGDIDKIQKDVDQINSAFVKHFVK